ncbi:unnamed protein product [Symbiodinium necroappetens]|uniref:Uncharacterized protein n=1 Tax=Symbiodinium necroappetens TaxID=1628268 RepID=A0A812PDA4_9DINO|nr:unnamed protein product [Symbiodinium necroappetens]
MAFHHQFWQVEEHAYDLINCCCCGISATPCLDPCCLTKDKCCCCTHGCTSGQDCNGEKGWLFSTDKCCCWISHFSLHKMGCALCNVHCWGEPYPGNDDPDMNFLPPLCWCFHCCCFAHALGSFFPACYQDNKLCIWEGKTTTGANCWSDEGFCHSHAKVCCCPLLLRCELPPNERIGCGFCMGSGWHSDSEVEEETERLLKKAGHPEQQEMRHLQH